MSSKRFDQEGWLPAIGVALFGAALIWLGRILQVIDDARVDLDDDR